MTLRAACIQKTRGLLMGGAWDGCEENPFQCMPASVLQELLSSMWPEGSRRSFAHLRLLLTSGRLEHVVLPPECNVAECIALLQMLSRGCRNLQTLHVRCDSCPMRCVDAELALREVLRRSNKLVLLHSGILLQPDDLRNCSNLKTLWLHFGAVEVFLIHVTSDLWEGPSESLPLRSVEVLAVCHNRFSMDESPPKIALLLDNCPQLTSLGLLESSVALKTLHDRDLRLHGTPRRFQLRRCFWGYKRNEDQSEYCERIRVAAQSCPLVEALEIEVVHAGALRHLCTLSNITRLHIVVYIEGFQQVFYSLLHHIGPQLRHLCVRKLFRGSLSLNAIGGNCPNLRTLQVEDCQVTADEGLSLPHLERLSVYEYVPRSLFPLLSSCPRLKVLCLPRAESLEDGVLQPILRKNPFAELEVVLIGSCSLSESGLRRLVQSASGLRSCCLESEILRNNTVMQCVRDVNPSVVCHPPYHFHKLRDEQFPLNMDTSCRL